MFKTELLIAGKYIKSKRKEKFISAIGAFSLVGIILGVATLIIVTSVMNGFRHDFMKRIIGFNGHITLSLINNNNDYSKAMDYINSLSEVAQAAPVIEKHALISTSKIVRGTVCHGISHKNLIKKEIIAKNICRGDLSSFEDGESIVIGDSLARKSNLRIGNEVIVMTPEMDETGFGFVPRKKTLKLIATFKSGMHEYDVSVSFISLKVAQKLFKMNDTISAISVSVKNPMDISKTKELLEQKFYSDFVITDWQKSNSSFMKAVEIERNVMFLILMLIILVASFNIISCMIMLVKDKEKDIAILKTIGLSQSSIMRIFFIVGASIGVVGTILGTICGVLFSINIQKIQALLETLLNVKVFSPEVYFLTKLPSLLQPADIVLTVIVSLLLSCLSTLYPARKASKLNPVEILRYA